MTEQEAKECAALDLAWMDIEKQVEMLHAVSHGLVDLGRTSPDVDTLIRGVCALVGLECKRRIRERAEQ